MVTYGHPIVFSTPTRLTYKKATDLGHKAKILPGISAEDCLFADLNVDPGPYGCQSFDATDFVLHTKKFDTCSHLILWQISVVGVLNHSSEDCNYLGLTVLADYLLQHYPPNHLVTVYEASQYPHQTPIINTTELSNLSNYKCSRLSTLFVPSLNKPKINNTIAIRLGLKKEESDWNTQNQII